MPKAKEIRAKAREAMAGKWGRFVGMNLLYLVVLMVIGLITAAPLLGSVGGLVDLATKAMAGKTVTEKMYTDVLASFIGTSALSSLLSIAAMLIEVPLAYALIENIMKAKRDNETTATYFLGRVFPSFGRAWKVTLWQFVKLIVPTILYMVGIMVAALVMGLLGGLGDAGAVIGGIVYFVAMVAIVIWYIGKVLNLSLSEYVAIDNPEITAKEAVEKSIELMPGYRWKLICLGLSFIGWAILCCFTLGIGNLFLTPYMAVADVVFYEEVLKAHGQTTEKEPVAEAPVAEPVVETPVAEEPVVEEQPTQE